jgi:membrane-associated phospholipid phosphatase
MAMSPHTAGRQRRTLAPLIFVTVAALVFAVLLVLVRLQWRPLETVDHGAAADINRAIAGDHTLVTVVKAVTMLGSTAVLCGVIGAAAAVLAIRRRWKLAIYLVVTGAGALVLDPVLKSLVGRLRPVVAHPVAYGTGNSFPSGHSLGSIVCYGAVLLVFLPAARGRWRPAFIGVTVALVALIGISRILLGVHFLSDVVGGWAIGITWLGVTALAFELTRLAAGQPVTDPVKAGLEPEAVADLRPAQPESAGGHARVRQHTLIAAGCLVAWVLIVGIIVGFGELIIKHGNGNVLGDRTIPAWFAARRTPALTRWSLIFTTLGGTVPDRGRRRQEAEAGRYAPGSPPANLGVPLRARSGHLLPIHRHRHPGHRQRPRLVALALPDSRGRHAGAGGPVPHVSRRASPYGRARQRSVRRALADRDVTADEAQPGRERASGACGEPSVRRERPQGLKRHHSPPFGYGGPAGWLPGDGPATVGLLISFEPVEVGADLGVGEQPAPPGAGLRRDAERRQPVARSVSVEVEQRDACQI